MVDYQSRAVEERWLRAEQLAADERRRPLEADREEERVRRQRNPPISASLSQVFGGLFSPVSSASSARDKSWLSSSMSGLSLNSQPPSKRTTNLPHALSSPHQHQQRLTDQYVRNEHETNQRLVRHMVQPTDDLVDLALRYDTTVAAIRRYNRRVVFEQLDNVVGEQIHIPVTQSLQLPVEPSCGTSDSSSAASCTRLDVQSSSSVSV